MIYLTRDEHKKYLVIIKNRIGKRILLEGMIRELIELGLIAGDYSRLYITDKG